MRVSIPGEPVAQGRPRFVNTAAGPRAIDPKKSRSWKALAQVFMQQAAKQQGWAIHEGPLGLSVKAFWPCPTSDRRKVPKPMRYRPKRPDGDNILKAVQDAGQGVLWHDDSQIVLGVVSKFTAAQDAPPGVEIEVWEITTEPKESR